MKKKEDAIRELKCEIQQAKERFDKSDKGGFVWGVAIWGAQLVGLREELLKLEKT